MRTHSTRAKGRWATVTPSGPELIDSYETLASYLTLYTGQYYTIGQSFTSNGDYLNSCEFYVNKDGSPTGNITATIYAHTGGYGTSGTGTGSVLATSEAIDISTVLTSNWLRFTFTGSNRIKLSNTYYVICINYSGGNSSNKLNVGLNNNGNASGNLSYKWESSWLTNGEKVDLMFKVYGTKSI